MSADGRTCSASKGKKERLVQATAEMMVELERHRRECDLPTLPSPVGDTPLMLPVGRLPKPLRHTALVGNRDFYEGADRPRLLVEDYAQRDARACVSALAASQRRSRQGRRAG